MSKSTKQRRHAQKMLSQWAVPFGFGHYTILVTLDPADAGTERSVWATIHSNIEEEWLHVYFDASLETLTDAQVEHVVVHELTHSLVEFAKASKATLEMACNRVASMLVGTEFGLREFFQGHVDAAGRYFDDELRGLLIEELPHLVVQLPEEHRSLLLSLFYDGKSLRDVAAERKVDQRTVRRWRDAALDALREMYLGGPDGE